jgi:hypothetical protein
VLSPTTETDTIGDIEAERVSERKALAKLVFRREAREALVVGGPVGMAIFHFYLVIASIIPFIAGLLGFSRRTPYLQTIALSCGLIYLDVVTFSDGLKYQAMYRLVLVDVGTTALFTIQLLFVFILAHFLGLGFRAGLIWVRNRLP